MFLKVNVTSFRRVGEEQDKSFTVFCIDVVTNGRRYVVERRYSEFYDLHKQLKRLIVTPSFPAKSVMKWSTKVLEHRRQLFEIYLQTVINEGSHPRCLLRFLDIATDDKAARCESLDDLVSGRVTYNNQPMVALMEDIYLSESVKGALPDIVTSGVLQGFYSSHSSVNDDS